MHDVELRNVIIAVFARITHGNGYRRTVPLGTIKQLADAVDEALKGRKSITISGKDYAKVPS